MLGRPTKPSSQRNDCDAGDEEEQSFVLPSGNQTDDESHRNRQEQPIKWPRRAEGEPPLVFSFGRHVIRLVYRLAYNGDARRYTSTRPEITYILLRSNWAIGR